MPNVSIIMGVYNCKNYNLLRKSVESILQQTYKDYEFIICNDGSTNNTLEELKKIAQSDSRIKIISYEKNRGLNHALNECLAVSQGKYIARQDDDDVSKPERLKKQVQFLDENREYAIVGTYDGVAYYSKRVYDEVFARCAINLALFVDYKGDYSELIKHMKIDDAFNFGLYKQLCASFL